MSESAKETRVVRSTVWSPGAGCHGGCGVDLFICDGKLEKVEGVADHPYNLGTLCPRALALKEYVYHPDRLTHPMIREGARGTDSWRQASWDEALDLIETRFRDIRNEHGAESAVFVQGTGRDVGGWMVLLAYNYGSPNWMQSLPGNSCYHPRLLAMKVALGDYVVPDASQFHAKRYDDPSWKLPECYMVWGQSPVATCNDGNHGHWIIHCLKRGSKLIVIDPHYTWLASRAAIWLPIRPGADGALALGMLNVIINERLYDEKFVDNWTVGFEELKARVQEYPLERVAEITWVRKELIAEAARLYAKSKSAALQWGVPVDMAAEGFHVALAINHLWCVTGNVENPGGMVVARPAFGVTSYPMTQEAVEAMYGGMMPPEQRAKRIGVDKFPMVKNLHWRAQPDAVIDQIFSGDPYPLKASFIAGTNFVVGAQDPRRWREAFESLDFNVVVDLFMTPTAMALADVVLPAASFPERDGVRAWWSPLTAQGPAIRVAECRSDAEICFALSKRLNDDFRFESLDDLYRFYLKPSGIPLEEVRERSWIMPPAADPSMPYERHERGLLRGDGKPGFATPSGKIELYSSLMERWGYDPLPSYTEPHISPVSRPDLAKDYPLILNTGSRTIAFFHSEHRMISSLRKMNPDPLVEINPETAKEQGIEDGDWVWLENHVGRCKMRAKYSLVHPRVVMAQHSWWYPEKIGEPDFGAYDSNVNVLIPGGMHSKTGFGGAQVKSLLCRVRKVEGDGAPA
ncbi:MAG: molybdopterin-dependent oxidoreductase [Nitrospinota bacterium]|jgi:anaerobic selenocysteine-containing dehydrogenase|nr:molybdopterin-dependent oxidoreductase [Nitrospinota bacterium]